MAILLNLHDSASRCLNVVRRHQRLIKQVVNDNELIQKVQPDYDVLSEKVQNREEKEIIRENAYDDLVLADRNLDDSLRTVFEKCKQYDRENLSERILIQIFPDETYGDLVKLPFAKEVDVINKIAIKLESLGTGHTLYPLRDLLKGKSQLCETAIQSVEDAIREIKLAEAEVEIAKNTLIRCYEANYLDARKKYGRSTADKLFPKVYNRKTTEQIVEEAA